MANDKENNNENSKSKRTMTSTNDKDNGSNKNKARSLFTSANDKQNDSAKSLFTRSKDKDNFNDKNKASSKLTGSLGAVLKGYKEQVARRLNEKAPNPQTPTNNNLPLNFTSILDNPSPPTYAEAHTTSPDIHDSNLERQDDFVASETSEQLMGLPSIALLYRIVLTENASKVITQSFHLRLDPEGSSWSGVTPETLSFYWEEFKKHCKWPLGLTEDAVMDAFLDRAADRYRNMTSNIRTRRVEWRPHDNIMKAWDKDWGTDESKKKSLQGKKIGGKTDDDFALVSGVLIPGGRLPQNIGVVHPALQGPRAFLINSDELSNFSVDVASFGSSTAARVLPKTDPHVEH
ncbi:hypothetical protein DM860_016766 [Cuscuta australis]|uniref:Uncharacterized protein n=1 Tax=Cuscuta australis TaxID=267555 RepID=A0A328DE45_9ASTE|nr:hypothetical protein DM860_016766 [Cuscuta australis]